MTSEPTPNEKRLAQAVVTLGMAPSEFRSLTLGEWTAIIAEFNRQNRKK
ncbi:hypothetical protein [Microbacterium sp. cf332]|nr:hypothetical protein [Microbacterium sp. cf332]SDQ11173.1 hypothetical protein SAMN04487847_0406 [Microbacterium sp. cf332]